MTSEAQLGKIDKTHIEIVSKVGRWQDVFGAMIVVSPLAQRIIATRLIITNSSFSLQGSYQNGSGERAAE